MITHKIEVVPNTSLLQHHPQHRPRVWQSPHVTKIFNQGGLDKYLAERPDFQVGRIIKYTANHQPDNLYGLHMILGIERDYSICKERSLDSGYLKCYYISNFSWHPTEMRPNWIRWEACWDMQVAEWETVKGLIDDNVQNNFKQWARRVGHNIPETCFS